MTNKIYDKNEVVRSFRKEYFDLLVRKKGLKSCCLNKALWGIVRSGVCPKLWVILKMIAVGFVWTNYDLNDFIKDSFHKDQLIHCDSFSYAIHIRCFNKF